MYKQVPNVEVDRADCDRIAMDFGNAGAETAIDLLDQTLIRPGKPITFIQLQDN